MASDRDDDAHVDDDREDEDGYGDTGLGVRRAVAVALLALALGEAIMLVLLADDLAGHSWIPPLICALLVAVAVSVLLAARRRAPDDPGTGRALVVLGSGIAFAALASTALLLAIYSIS